MGWQLRRGLLNPADGEVPRQSLVAGRQRAAAPGHGGGAGHALGLSGPPSSWSASCCMEFAERPSTRTWYRAHNASIVAAYLRPSRAGRVETHPERFFLNLILVRVLFAHALVAAPRLALSWLWPVGPLLGDPRLTITGIFVSLSRVMPDSYPLTRDLQWYVDNEHGFGRLLDLGMIQPRLGALYSWSAAELSIPELCTLVRDGVPPTRGTPPMWSRGTRRRAGWLERRDRYFRHRASVADAA